MPVKIAYLIGHLKTGGTQKHLYELLRRLDRSRFAPRIYCLRGKGDMVQEFRRLGVHVEDLQLNGGGPKGLVRLFRFARQLKKQEISILHCYLPRANFFGAIAGRMARVPIVLISKRTLEAQKELKQIVRCRWADAWADAVVANSAEALRHAVVNGGCSLGKLHLVANGVDLSRYRTPVANGSNGKQPMVGTVVRLEAVKGPDAFVQAAARIAAEMPQARFVVVGDGAMREDLERAAAALGLGDRIRFMGQRDDVADILPTFSVFILPSLIEGMSMALLEAMAAARPIVATAVGGNVDLITHGENGLLVPPGDPEKMARAALQLLNNPAWASGLGRAAQTLVLHHHSADSMVRRLEEIYHELLQARGLKNLQPVLRAKGEAQKSEV